MLTEDHGISVRGDDISAQLSQLRLAHPDIYQCIDMGRVQAWQDELANSSWKDDFGSVAAGGRGGAYVHAQSLNVRARARGIDQLMGLMRQDSGGRRLVVDLLGGDGLVRRVCALLGMSDVDVITCDASPYMVQSAWATGIPALLQRAERPLFLSESVDGVLLAYGTHHIPPEDRQVVVEEACRMLRPGGTFVLHDFLAGSPMDTWFETVVDQYSQTGHQYVHFTIDEIMGYLVKAGFDSYEVLEIDDPYTAIGSSPEEAELRLGEYLVNMYGLSKAEESQGKERAFRWAADQGKAIFRYQDDGGTASESVIEYVDEIQAWRFTIPRRAAVGVGKKVLSR